MFKSIVFICFWFCSISSSSSSFLLISFLKVYLPIAIYLSLTALCTICRRTLAINYRSKWNGRGRNVISFVVSTLWPYGVTDNDNYFMMIDYPTHSLCPYSPRTCLYIVGTLRFISLDINRPSLPTLFSVCGFVSATLSTVFHSITSPHNSPLFHSVLTALLALPTTYSLWKSP